MNTTVDIKRRKFRFARLDGTVIGTLILNEGGIIGGDRSKNETFWGIGGGNLVFLNEVRAITTVFNHISRNGNSLCLRGAFLPNGPAPWHTLTEIVEPSHCGIVQQLLSTLYGGQGPFSSVNFQYVDHGYPHTNLRTEVARSIIKEFQPKFWLEIGSMLGGSAIRVADVVKSEAAATEIICVDPFTGDVNMWDWEQRLKQANKWRFLRLEHGRSTVYDRFLANVAAAGHADIILPITATSIVGVKLLQRLFDQERLKSLPDVIYLDSAHEPDETFLELRNCWNLLEAGGVLMGDDWDWESVRNDVLRFAKTIRLNAAGRQRLGQKHPSFTQYDGILLDRGQWVLVK